MEPLKESENFLNFISAVSNPLLSLLVGVAVTALIQSCSASIGILQALSVTGAISYEVAVPMILGMCIGACVPVLLSALTANVNGRRAAFIYLYFNLAGSLIFLIVFYGLNAIFDFAFLDEAASSVGIAIINTIYKVSATVVLAPFAGTLEKIAVLTIRDKSTEEDDEFENLLDERFLNYPPLAIEQSGKTMERMAQAAFKNLTRSMELLSEFNQVKYDKIMSRENVVDRYEDQLGGYLVRLNGKVLSDAETKASAKYLHCLTNVERISDHAVNLAELAQEMHEKNISFSQEAKDQLSVCIEAVLEIADMTRTALLEDNLDIARKVEPLEEIIDTLTEELKVLHIARLQAGACTLELGFVFNDCINNFERVADHCSNIAVAVLETADMDIQAHDYLRGIKQNNEEGFRRWTEYYEEKYCRALQDCVAREQESDNI